jgi:hypothetical protein
MKTAAGYGVSVVCALADDAMNATWNPAGRRSNYSMRNRTSVN